MGLVALRSGAYGPEERAREWRALTADLGVGQSKARFAMRRDARPNVPHHDPQKLEFRTI